MVAVLFILLGARSYAEDVAVIEQEMVETAIWVDANLPADALLAVHDIGAIGYFTQQPLVDLAGLVTPDVIPFIRDETRMSVYLDEQGVDYLITFPDFYKYLMAEKEVVFVTNGKIADEQNFVRMTIYRWK